MSKTIVVADDSMFARMLLKEAVAQIFTGANYIEASSGQQVIDKHKDGTLADWYLLDVNMGEPNGLETAEALIKEGVDVSKITLVTGNKSSELQKQADSISLNLLNKALAPSDVDAFVERLNNFFHH